MILLETAYACAPSHARAHGRSCHPPGARSPHRNVARPPSRLGRRTGTQSSVWRPRRRATRPSRPATSSRRRSSTQMPSSATPKTPSTTATAPLPTQSSWPVQAGPALLMVLDCRGGTGAFRRTNRRPMVVAAKTVHDRWTCSLFGRSPSIGCLEFEIATVKAPAARRSAWSLPASHRHLALPPQAFDRGLQDCAQCLKLDPKYVKAFGLFRASPSLAPSPHLQHLLPPEAEPLSTRFERRAASSKGRPKAHRIAAAAHRLRLT